jgi:hypothetical protein
MTTPANRESEYGYVSSEIGLPKKRPVSQLTASDKLRLGYIGTPNDPASKYNERRWLGLNDNWPQRGQVNLGAILTVCLIILVIVVILALTGNL